MKVRCILLLWGGGEGVHRVPFTAGYLLHRIKQVIICKYMYNNNYPVFISISAVHSFWCAFAFIASPTLTKGHSIGCCDEEWNAAYNAIIQQRENRSHGNNDIDMKSVSHAPTLRRLIESTGRFHCDLQCFCKLLPSAHRHTKWISLNKIWYDKYIYTTNTM